MGGEGRPRRRGEGKRKGMGKKEKREKLGE